jgi:hypothetical protein
MGKITRHRHGGQEAVHHKQLQSKVSLLSPIFQAWLKHLCRLASEDDNDDNVLMETEDQQGWPADTPMAIS